MKGRFPRLLTCVLLATTAIAACSSSSSAPKHNTPSLFADPNSPLRAVATSWSGDGRKADAGALRALAAVPSAVWAAGQPGDIKEIKAYSVAATRANRIGVVVAYNLPDRDSCGGFSASNANTANSKYRKWIDQLAAAIGESRDVVIVEPDALPDIVRGCLSKNRQISRYQLLQYAMQTLGRLPHAQVYLDAGNPGMFQNPSTIAAPLVKAGVYYGKGFSTNVSNFQQTDLSVAWSQGIESQLGHGMQSVIDTSRNGHGPYASTTKLSGPTWCNPPGRAVGIQPTFDTGKAGIAAYLWIKDPGISDGACNGGPAAGVLWPEYALGLVKGSSP